jgi:hypothetical protein
MYISSQIFFSFVLGCAGGICISIVVYLINKLSSEAEEYKKLYEEECKKNQYNTENRRSVEPQVTADS